MKLLVDPAIYVKLTVQIMAYATMPVVLADALPGFMVLIARNRMFLPQASKKCNENSTITTDMVYCV